MSTPIRLVDETGIERFRGTQSSGGGSQPGASRWRGPCKIGFADVQTITSGQPWYTAAGGYVTFTVNGETTGHVAFNASAADLKAALEALPSITSPVTVAFPLGGANITDADTITARFAEREATDLLAADASNLTGAVSPYPDQTALSGDESGNIVVEMFTPATGDIVEDFLHAVVTAFDVASELTYTDDPATPDGNGPVWANPTSAQGVGGIDVTSADDSYTNFYGDNGSDPRQEPSALTALMASWAATAAAADAHLYGNLPNVVKNAVPLYTVIQGVSGATQGEVWIWVKTATPAPLMD